MSLVQLHSDTVNPAIPSNMFFESITTDQICTPSHWRMFCINVVTHVPKRIITTSISIFVCSAMLSLTETMVYPTMRWNLISHAQLLLYPWITTRKGWAVKRTKIVPYLEGARLCRDFRRPGGQAL